MAMIYLGTIKAEMYRDHTHNKALRWNFATLCFAKSRELGRYIQK